MKKNKKAPRQINTTKYGEFVCSAYQWLPIGKQKEQVKEIEKMTKKQKTTTT